MSVDSFKEDMDGLRMRLEQEWRERKERKEAGTETEFGPRTRSKPRSRRYKVATGSVTTNGLVVRGTAFDTSQHPGMAFPCAATTLLPDPDSCEARNILVSKASLTEHTTGFMRRLEAKKAQPISIDEHPGVVHRSMKEVEDLIPARGIPGLQLVQQYAQWYCTHEHVVKSFYCSTWYKRLQWKHNKLVRSEYDKVFDTLVHSASADLATRKAHRDVLAIDQDSGFCTNLVIMIGNGVFGPTSRHRTLIRHLIKKVHEEHTSSRCPRGHHELIKYSRSVECRTCNICLHRDSAGAHNIAFIGREHVRGRPRPEKFRRIN
ncbi:hypothetical protein BGZ70_001091 [Mortierella alpina]|uniref:Cas12f1-like TNB domain-containing protein n=1 Tax=Mortierella alpina TaxID=64518 RepID=A0A9P6LYB1_MORAP|nr:hypothetical protein BGZ70_001091 [Mortierella alpina]